MEILNSEQVEIKMPESNTNRWKLTFEYDGSAFNGWQIQPRGRTVEGVIEEAFSKLYQTDIDIIGQGRTDAGVHALGQVAHADLPVKYEGERILHAMKGLLPEDVALLNAEPVEPNFHARFHAKSRQYKYQMAVRPTPVLRHQAWQYFKTPDESILHHCAGMILGRFDFVNFCIPSGVEHTTTICTLFKSEWHKEGELWVYRIEGDRFLRHMVRRLVGEMVKAAEKPGDSGRFEGLFNGKGIRQKAHSAPAKGLFLEAVNYSDK